MDNAGITAPTASAPLLCTVIVAPFVQALLQMDRACWWGNSSQGPRCALVVRLGYFLAEVRIANATVCIAKADPYALLDVSRRADPRRCRVRTARRVQSSRCPRFQMLVDLRNHRRAFADRNAHALDRAGAQAPNGEWPGTLASSARPELLYCLGLGVVILAGPGR